jgi:hypothetical protein
MVSNLSVRTEFHCALSLTLLEVVRLPYVDADQSHQLQLGQTLPCGRRERKEVPQVCDLCIDQIAAQLAGALGGLAGVEPARQILAL